jgi:ribose/xylose/arabinose/galactoside ABC-type transport system permease subunit
VFAVMFLVSLAVLLVIERRMFMGRAVVLTGGNKVAARLAGIPISRSIVMIYAISGLMSAIGAVILVSRVTLADPNMGVPYMTQAILAVVVGGTALVGGRGSVLWTVVGAFLLVLLNNCLNLLGVSSYVQFMLWGVILIAVIWLIEREERGRVRPEGIPRDPPGAARDGGGQPDPGDEDQLLLRGQLRQRPEVGLDLPHPGDGRDRRPDRSRR